jgi:hypothetical protein
VSDKELCPMSFFLVKSIAGYMSYRAALRSSRSLSGAGDPYPVRYIRVSGGLRVIRNQMGESSSVHRFRARIGRPAGRSIYPIGN